MVSQAPFQLIPKVPAPSPHDTRRFYSLMLGGLHPSCRHLALGVVILGLYVNAPEHHNLWARLYQLYFVVVLLYWKVLRAKLDTFVILY